MYLGYFYNLPSGPAIVFISFALFILAFLFSRSQGLLTRTVSGAGKSAIGREIKSIVGR